MKTGDPKKVLVLVVVALVVLGVAVVRILPKSEQGPRAVEGAEKTADVAAVVSSQELVLRGDPFYHPKLELPSSAPDVGEADPAGAAPLDVPSGGLPNPARWGVPSGWIPGLIGIRPSTGDTGDPEEKTGKGQQTKKTRKVVLNAVLSVASPFAYLSVDGTEFRVGIGGEVPGIGTIAAITSGSVTVVTARGKVVFEIGEAVEL
ncbi:MAG: hypothetical protein M9921_06760 [Fimbriimonadaceae bacterium]|nr:hypothetical protein [Chthonomonadaceae bacterium]MCO5296538.1 hypothetical protein [Fimbriimonadaceae bacterium]